jgi:hypothetical protein
MKFQKTHGMSGTRVHRLWKSMLRRCRNPAYHQFRDYGGRGIKVCDRWLEFANFYADMGEPPPGTSLDRIRNNGNYTPDNCRWATPIEQNNNKRNSRLLTFLGKTQNLKQWSVEIGITPGGLIWRLNHWSFESVFQSKSCS